MQLLEKFVQHLTQFPFVQPQQKQLIAVSGGVDSVVLCDLMYKASYDFIIAHCNFQLRGSESDRDEIFVRNLGEKYNKQVLIKHFETETYATNNKISIQVAARQLRYEWFYSLLHAYKDRNIETAFLHRNTPFDTENLELANILTAHHANDHIETVLMNFFKGTGISGLHGIVPFQKKLFRPLLFVLKKELVGYSKQNNLSFVEDSSNSYDKYTRNFFRNQMFPLLKEIYPNVEENLLKNIERFTEAEELYKQAIALHKKNLLEYKLNEIHIPILKLQKATPVGTIMYEILKEYGFTSAQLKEVLGLLHGETGKYVSSSTYRVIKNRNWLIISPTNTEDASNIVIDAQDKKIVFTKGELAIERFDKLDSFQIPTSSTIAVIDFAQLTFPMILRKWKSGDYFYPLGMKRKKKLSRFFIDQKLSKTEKENIWVLEMDKKIVWIVNQRIDDRFKIKHATKKIWQVRYTHS